MDETPLTSLRDDSSPRSPSHEQSSNSAADDTPSVFASDGNIATAAQDLGSNEGTDSDSASEYMRSRGEDNDEDLEGLYDADTEETESPCSSPRGEGSVSSDDFVVPDEAHEHEDEDDARQAEHEVAVDAVELKQPHGRFCIVMGRRSSNKGLHSTIKEVHRLQ